MSFSICFHSDAQRSSFLAENGLSFKTKRHHKPCGTKPAVIIKLCSELCRIVPTHAGKGCSGNTPFPPLKGLIRRHGSSKSVAIFFQHDSSASSGPRRPWERLLMAVGLKENLEGPSCQSCPLPTPSIYHIPTLSAHSRTACSIYGLLAREREATTLGGGPVSSPQL